MIDDLSRRLDENNIIYIADISNLDAVATSSLRRQCFAKNIKLSVVKKYIAQESNGKCTGKDFTELYEVLPGPTAIMLSDTGNLPAKLIKDFRKKSDKPVLKGAFVEESIYIGDDQLNLLADIKSKDELIGEVIGLLQSPAKNVISALTQAKEKLLDWLKPFRKEA